MSENDNIQVENSEKPYSDKAYEIIDQSHNVYWNISSLQWQQKKDLKHLLSFRI